MSHHSASPSSSSHHAQGSIPSSILKPALRRSAIDGPGGGMSSFSCIPSLMRSPLVRRSLSRGLILLGIAELRVRRVHSVGQKCLGKFGRRVAIDESLVREDAGEHSIFWTGLGPDRGKLNNQPPASIRLDFNSALFDHSAGAGVNSPFCFPQNRGNLVNLAGDNRLHRFSDICHRVNPPTCRATRWTGKVTNLFRDFTKVVSGYVCRLIRVRPQNGGRR